MNRLLLISLWIFCTLFSGCCRPIVTRPPSAAAFMDGYGRDYATYMGSVSLYLGDLINDSNSAGYSGSDGGTKYREWFADFHAVAYKSFGYFSLGEAFKVLHLFIKMVLYPLILV